jgi:tetratricopeptide (TPR) repeat protein
LLLQNLGFDRWPVWHYAVLIGFDSHNEKFLLRSGTTHRQQSRARPFLASWERAGRWSMVVVSASDPPVGADVLGWLRAIAPFESIGNLEMAAEGYEAGVARWPEEALAWTALGNVRYLQRELADAEAAYQRALALSPELWPARNNLVRTMIARGCPELAQPWVAGAGVPPVEFAPIWNRTLRDLAGTAEESCRDMQIADQ